MGKMPPLHSPMTQRSRTSRDTVNGKIKADTVGSGNRHFWNRSRGHDSSLIRSQAYMNRTAIVFKLTKLTGRRERAGSA